MADMTINAANYPEIKPGQKAPRKYAAHVIDASFGGATPIWYRIGEDNDSLAVEMNPDTEVRKNILGTSSFVHNGYEPSANVDTFYAKRGDKLFNKLHNAVKTQESGDGLKTVWMDVYLWNKGTDNNATVYEASQQTCYVIPDSYGGDTSGVQIPFTANFIGERTAGAYNPTSKTFTAGTWSENYTAVSNPTGNPSELGYYERSGDAGAYVYTLSADTTVDSEKTYYSYAATFTAATN